MTDTSITVDPVSGTLGAEVHGIDLSSDLSNDTWSRVHQAFLEHKVLFFREQSLTPAQQVAFARRFGPLAIYPYVKGLPEQPEVIAIVKEPEERANFGGTWHSDTTYEAHPPLGTALYAVETPAAGGDTAFADAGAAFRALSPALQAFLEPLRAVNSAGRSGGGAALKQGGNIGKVTFTDEPEPVHQAVHPVVRTHPETGEKVLYINAIHTSHFEGWTEAESRPLLDFLIRHLEQAEFGCRFRWAPGSLAIWDNRACQHLAINDYHGHRRVMHRCTIEGDRPV